MRLRPWVLYVGISILSLHGCSDLHSNTPRLITSGSHVPFTDEEWSKIQRNEYPKLRFIVWANHAGAAQAATQALQNGNSVVIERARLHEIFEEQRIQLTHSSDDDSKILKVGRLAGADRIVFIEVIDRPELTSGAYVGPYGGVSRSDTLYHVSVSVRSVNIETAQVLASGTATYTSPIDNPETGIPTLTKAAIARATCPVERGLKWIEHGEDSSGKLGCVKEK